VESADSWYEAACSVGVAAVVVPVDRQEVRLLDPAGLELYRANERVARGVGGQSNPFGKRQEIRHTIRLRLLSSITSAPDREICVCDITGDDFSVFEPTISHHLKVLRGAGLIKGERRGTWVYYRPQPANLPQLAARLNVPTFVAA
jgi:DNA-binding transcriptional ArsR family regulator